MSGAHIPEFSRMLKVPIIIDFIADPPFEISSLLDKVKQIQLATARINAIQKLQEAQLRFITQATEIQQGYLRDVTKILG
jgi:hypothetical protein